MREIAGRHGRLSLCAVGVIASCAVHSPVATAQIGSPKAATIPVEGKATLNQTRVVMYNYAKCVLKARRRKVDAYLTLDPGSNEAQKLAQIVAVRECLDSGQLKFNERIFRGGLYDALYRSTFARSTVDISHAPRVKYFRESPDDAPAAGDWMNMYEFADCVVRHAPDKVRVLILTDVATERETQAFREIMPALSSCMNANMTLRFSPTLLRGYIGEALYRVSAAASLNRMQETAE